MGSSSSSSIDYASEVTTLTMSYLNEFTQDCSESIMQTQGIYIVNCDNVTISDVDQTEMVSVSSTCMMQQTAASLESKDEIDADITAAVTALATTMATSLGADADTITTMALNVSTTQSNIFYQDCSSEYTQIQQVSCSDSTGGSISGINQSELIDATVSCTMNDTESSSAYTDMNVQMNAMASSTSGTSGAGGKYLVLIIIIFFSLAILIGVIYAIVKAERNRKGKK